MPPDILLTSKLHALKGKMIHYTRGYKQNFRKKKSLLQSVLREQTSIKHIKPFFLLALKNIKLIFISLLREMELKPFQIIKILLVPLQQLPENPERKEYSNFLTAPASPGSAVHL